MNRLIMPQLPTRSLELEIRITFTIKTITWKQSTVYFKRKKTSCIRKTIYMLSSVTTIERWKLFSNQNKLTLLICVTLWKNVSLPYNVTLLHEVNGPFKLVIEYKKLHFESSNKVNFTPKAAYHTKWRRATTYQLTFSHTK